MRRAHNLYLHFLSKVKTMSKNFSIFDFLSIRLKKIHTLSMLIMIRKVIRHLRMQEVKYGNLVERVLCEFERVMLQQHGSKPALRFRLRNSKKK